MDALISRVNEFYKPAMTRVQTLCGPIATLVESGHREAAMRLITPETMSELSELETGAREMVELIKNPP